MKSIGDSKEEVFAQIGIHLLLIQDLEYLLRFALRVALKEPADITIDALTDEDRRTMGQFMHDLNKDAILHTDLDGAQASAS